MKKLSLCFLSCILLSCKTGKMPVPQYQNKPISALFDKEGHRGCRGLMPENTIPGFLTAIDLAVTTLEMDVQISKDSQVVVSHDPYFNSAFTTRPDGGFITQEEGKNLVLFQMPYSEIKRYDVGMKQNPAFPHQKTVPAHKPLLSSVFDSVIYYMRTMRRPPILYNIEIKSNPQSDGIYHPDPVTFADLVMSVIKNKIDERYITIQSFDNRPLQYLHKIYPDLRLSLLIEKSDKRSLSQQLADLGFVPTVYSPEFTIVTPELIHECHEKGIEIIPWTVNEKSEIDKLKREGVDGIISDYPNLFNE